MTVLGKRKKPEGTVSQEEAEAIFRRHFEAQFQPIDENEKKHKPTKSQDDEDDDHSADSEDDEDADEQGEDDDGEDAEWGGLSEDDEDDDEIEDDDEPQIEVIDHSQPRVPNPEGMSKSELKAFMSSRPPDQSARSKPVTTTTSTKPSPILPEDAPSLLAQDLELRRLLSESHLLASPTLTNRSALTGAEPKLFTAGRIRHKAADLRLQALGSKESILKQQKMPMNMRKGINAAAAARETKRRREAKENNVILEHDTGKKKRKRDRGKESGVDGPSVGRLRGAELRINERDVRSIEGTRDVFGRKGGKGRRR